MSRLLNKLILPFCLLLFPIATAQEKSAPQILFLGDNVQGAIVQAAAKELGKQVSVTLPQDSVSDSGSALAKIESLLGDKKWDIIYFNYGIGDLFYKDPATKEIRIMCKHSGGVRVSTPAQYEKQLDALVLRLKKTNAKLIWGSTTPLVNVNSFPSFQGNLFDADSEREYNSIAARVMEKHKVPVLDLHGHVMEQFKPEDKHPPYHQYEQEMAKRGQPLQKPLVEAIVKAVQEFK